MGNTPLYSEGRNVRRLEGSGRKETSLIQGRGGGGEGSFVPEAQHVSLHFAVIRVREVRAQRRDSDLQPRSPERTGCGALNAATTGFSLWPSGSPGCSPISPGSVPRAWRECVGLRAREAGLQGLTS